MDIGCLFEMVLKMVVERVSVKVPWKERVKMGEEDALGVEKAYA
jgi:hypothetical protein